MPAHRQVRAVELDGCPGGGDRLVLVAHRLGDGEHVLLPRVVVLVGEEQRHDPRRCRAGERAGHVDTGHGGDEVLHVAPGGIWVAHGDRPRARRSRSLAPPRVGSDQLGAAREVDQVGEVITLCRLTVESAEAVLDVGRVGRLRHLPIVDDRHAGPDLPADGLEHRRFDPRLQRRGIDRDPVADCPHHLDEVVGPGEAPGVGAQDAVGVHRPPQACSGSRMIAATSPRMGVHQPVRRRHLDVAPRRITPCRRGVRAELRRSLGAGEDVGLVEIGGEVGAERLGERLRRLRRQPVVELCDGASPAEHGLVGMELRERDHPRAVGGVHHLAVRRVIRPERSVGIEVDDSPNSRLPAAARPW